MKMKRFIGGPVSTCMYLVCEGADAVIIDPAYFDEDMLRIIKEEGLTLHGYLLTHAHFDHTMGMSDYFDLLGGSAYVGEADADMLYCPEKDASMAFGLRYTQNSVPDRICVKEGDELKLGELFFRVIGTPGHTAGGVCYYNEKEKALFSGDTLFRSGFGRTDLYSGSYEDLMKSITEKLMKLDDDTSVFPGHGGATTIGREKRMYGLA